MTTHNGKILVWQWGRHGAGPRFASELAWALGKFTSLQPLLSLSSNAELYLGLNQHSPVDFPVVTYSGTADAVRKTMGLPRLLNSLETFVARERPIAAISVMAGYWDVFAANRLIKLGVPVITIVHDAKVHPGDWLAPIVAMHRRQVAASAGVITLTDFVANELANRKLFERHRHTTIAHPAFVFPELDLPKVSRSDFGGHRPLRLVLPGRLKRYKGTHLLLEALGQIEPSRVHVRFVGAADNKEWIDAAKLLPNCELDLRWQTEADLVAEIDGADVLMAPYIEASQSGTVAIALGRGRPVIATPVGGLPEQIEHGETGLLAENVTADAVAACIQRFIEDPAFYHQCAERALVSGTSEIGWRQIAQQYANAASTLANAN